MARNKQNKSDCALDHKQGAYYDCKKCKYHFDTRHPYSKAHFKLWKAKKLAIRCPYCGNLIIPSYSYETWGVYGN